MATSLSRQLKHLVVGREFRDDDGGVSLPHSHHVRASLLFDGKEAADMDMDTIYALGINGLMELKHQHPEFENYERFLLFTSSTKDATYESLRTAEMKPLIEDEMNTFLRKLSPYVLLKPAQKILEWLIRRFAIQEDHVQEVLGCILPYHETPFFSQMLRLMKIPETSPFSFLSTMKRAKQPLSKLNLVQHCLHRRGVFVAICDIVEIYRKEGDVSKSLHGFVVSLMVHVLRTIKGKKMDPLMLRTLLAYLLQGFKESQDTEGLLGCYMILSQLAQVVDIDRETLNALVIVMSRRLKEDGPSEKETLLCIANVIQSQHVTELPMRLVQRLVLWKQSLSVLGELVKEFELKYFIRSLVMSLWTQFSEASLDISTYLSNLLRDPSMDVHVFQVFVEELLSIDHLEEPIVYDWLSKWFSSVRYRYPDLLDRFIRGDLKHSLLKLDSKVQSQLIMNSFQLKELSSANSSEVHEMVLTSKSRMAIFLACQDGNPMIRRVALDRLKEILSWPLESAKILQEPESRCLSREEFMRDIRDMVLPRLVDEDAEVASRAWNMMPYLFSYIASDLRMRSAKHALKNHVEDDRVVNGVLDWLMLELEEVSSSPLATLIEILEIVAFILLSSPGEKKENEPTMMITTVRMMCFLKSLLHNETRWKRCMLFRNLNVHELKMNDPTGSLNSLIETIASNLYRNSHFNVHIQLMYWLFGTDEEKRKSSRSISTMKTTTQEQQQPDFMGTDRRVWISQIKPAFGLALLSRLLRILTADDWLNLVTPLLSQIKAKPSITRESSNIVHDADGTLNTDALYEEYIDLPVDSIMLRQAILSLPTCFLDLSWLTVADRMSNQVFTIMLNLFKLVFRSKDHSSESSCLFLFTEKILSSSNVLSFLCRLATLTPSTDYRTMTQLKALQLILAFVKASESKHIAFFHVTSLCLIMSTLLVHPNRTVRQHALAVVHACHPLCVEGNRQDAVSDVFWHVLPDDKMFFGSTDPSGGDVEDLFKTYCRSLIEIRAEDILLADSEMMLRILCEKFQMAIANQTPGDGRRQRHKRQNTLDLMVGTLCNMVFAVKCTPIRKHLLRFLKLMPSSMKLVKCIGFLRDHAEHLDPEDRGLYEELAICVTFFDEHSIKLLEAEESETRDVLLSFLMASPPLETPESQEAVKDQLRHILWDHLRKGFFAICTPQLQYTIALALLDSLCDAPSSWILELKAIFTENPMSIKVLNHLLVVSHEELLQVMMDQRSEDTLKKPKRFKEVKIEEESVSRMRSKEGLARSIEKLVCALEILQYKKDVYDTHRLLPILFEILNTCVSDRMAAQDYLRQLVLMDLKEVFEKARTQNASIGLSQIRIDLLVQCLRVGENAQTHTFALMALDAATWLAPDLVLQNVMPIFTFMSVAIIRQDDSFSLQTLQQTLRTLLPSLIHADRNKYGDSSAKDKNDKLKQGNECLLGILTTFINAFHHIPKHRRHHLFSTLVSTLGIDRSLGPLFLLALQKVYDDSPMEVSQKNVSTMVDGSERTSEELREFLLSLFVDFPVKAVFTTLHQILEFVSELPHEPNTSSTLLHPVPIGVINYDITRQSIGTTQQYKLACLTCIRDLLTYKNFLLKLAPMELVHQWKIRQSHESKILSPPGPYEINDAHETLEQAYLETIERSMQLIDATCSKNLKKDESRSRSRDYSKQLSELSLDILDRLVLLLPNRMFVEVISRLFRHNEQTVRTHSLSLLINRVKLYSDTKKSSEKIAEARLFTGLLGNLETLLLEEDALGTMQENRDIPHGEEETIKAVAIPEARIISKQTTLLAAEALVQHFGHLEPDSFMAFLPCILGKTTLQSSVPQIAATSIICLASFVAELGVRTIVHLPKYMPDILRACHIPDSQHGLENHVEKKPSHRHRSPSYAHRPRISKEQLFHWSAFMSLSTIMATLPQFMAPYLREIVDSILQPALFDWMVVNSMETSSSSKLMSTHTASFQRAVRKLYRILATKMPLDELLPAWYHVFENETTLNRTFNVLFFKPWNEMISQIHHDDIRKNARWFFKLYLNAFERHTKLLMSSEGSNEFKPIIKENPISDYSLESTLLDSFIEFVLKLNEASFRPLFLKLMDWISNDSWQQDQIQSSTNSTKMYRSTLGYRLIEGLALRLKTLFVPYIVYVIDDILNFLSQFPEKYAIQSDLALRSWVSIINFLKASLEYDTNGFLKEKLADRAFVDALVVQLEYTIDGKASYEKRLQEHWVPCIVQLSTSIREESFWKLLHYQLLLKTRQTNPSIRWIALQTVQSLYHQLGVEFLVLLPETIPFLAELMEDEDSTVELCCQKTIAVIEGHLGESIQTYLH